MMKTQNIFQFQSMETNFKSKQKKMKLNQSYQVCFQSRFLIGWHVSSQLTALNVSADKNHFENT